MRVVFSETPASDELRLRVETLVRSQLQELHTSSEVSVFLARRRRGGWSVFISGAREHPLAAAQKLEAALGSGF